MSRCLFFGVALAPALGVGYATFDLDGYHVACGELVRTVPNLEHPRDAPKACETCDGHEEIEIVTFDGYDRVPCPDCGEADERDPGDDICASFDRADRACTQLEASIARRYEGAA